MVKAAAKSTQSNLRFERKFVFTNTPTQYLIEKLILNNAYCFTEIYTRRTVNNIYLDDNDLSFYRQNVSGDEWREKYRLRWYGDNFSEINNPTLEIKKKYGDVGDKVSFKLTGFILNIEGLSMDEVYAKILLEVKNTKNKALLSKMTNLSPTLYNSYERQYFLSHCENFRITSDYNMKFYSPQMKDYLATEMRLSDTILELKYDRQHDDESRQLSQQLNSRLSKNSKYVRGIELTAF